MIARILLKLERSTPGDPDVGIMGRGRTVGTAGKHMAIVELADIAGDTTIPKILGYEVDNSVGFRVW